MELSKEPQTDSADYAIRYGGVWLEFHERVAFAEHQLKLVNEERAVLQQERDNLLLTKINLETKFKNSVASLTQTETNHLEARQIIERVHEEHKDLSRRCLAAEAHTEWLEDQLKQQKAVKALKEEEICALQFRIENLKSTLAETDITNSALKNTISTKDREIEHLVCVVKSRDEELVVLSRSNHTKDKQLAQVVRERNGLKEDLEATQRSLALARRTSSSSTRRSEIEKQKEAGQIQTSTTGTTFGEYKAALRRPEGTVEPASKMTAAASLDITNSAGKITTTAATTSATEAVLRKYKQSRMHSRRAASLCGSAAGSTVTTEVTGAMMLDDILESVLASETPANAAGLVDGDNDMDTSDSCDAQAQFSSLPAAAFTTPVATRKCKAVTESVNNLCAAENANVTASLLLDDNDFDFIDDILDSVTPGGFSPRATKPNTTPTLVSKRLASTSLTTGTFDATVHKMLFGGDSPVPVRSANPWGGAVTTPLKLLDAGNSAPGACTNASADDAGCRTETPLTAMVMTTPGSTDTVGSAVTDDAFPSTPQDSIQDNHTCSSKSVTIKSSNAASVDITLYVEREQNYKSALYLLQEEVRMLRAQVAAHGAAKRAIRTPKKASTSSASTLSDTTRDTTRVRRAGFANGKLEVRPTGKVLFGEF